MFPIFATFSLSIFTFFVAVTCAPALDAGSLKQNGISAQQLNTQFASIKKTDSCNGSAMACVEGAFAQCVGSKWVLTECASGTQCFALPLVNKVGTSITCDSNADTNSRITSTGAAGGLLGSTSQASSFAVNGTDTDGADCADGTDGNDNDNGNSTLSGTNGTSSTSGNGTSVIGGSGSSSGSDGSDDCDTVTVTVTALASTTDATESSSPLTFSQTNSATLATGVSLPPTATNTGDIVSSSNTSSTADFFSAPTNAPATASSSPSDGFAYPTPTITGFENATITLTPASASAFLSSLSAADPGISISTLGDSAPDTTATPAYAGNGANAAAADGSAPITLSFFSTSYAPTGTPASLAASATPSTASTGGYGGYGYRRGVRRV